MTLPIAGVLSSGAGFVQALTAQSSLMTFNDASGNTLLAFDAVVTEQYSQQSAPTAYPVEDGATVADHITRLPCTFTVTGIVTDTPLHTKKAYITEGITTAASAILPPLGVVAGAVASSFINPQAQGASPSQLAFFTLKKMQLGAPYAKPPISPQPFTVVSKFGTYENIMIQEMTVPREADTGGALIFNLTLVQVNVVAPQTIPLSNLDTPVIGAAKSGVGQQGSPEDGQAEGQVDGMGATLSGVLKGENTLSTTNQIRSTLGGAISDGAH